MIYIITSDSCYRAAGALCFLLFLGTGCLPHAPEKDNQNLLLTLLGSGGGSQPVLLSTSPGAQGFQSIVDTDYTFSPTQPQAEGSSWVEQIRHKRTIVATFNGHLDMSGLQNPGMLPASEVRDDNGVLIPGTIDFVNSPGRGEVQFIPAGLLPVNQTIHVNLSGLRSENGAPILSQPLQFSFSTSRATAGYDPFNIHQTLDVRCKGTLCKIRLYPTADIQGAFSQGIPGGNISWYVDLALYTLNGANIHVIDSVNFQPDVSTQIGVNQPIFVEFSVARAVWRDALFNRASNTAENRHIESVQIHISDTGDVNADVLDGNFEIVFSEEP